MFWSCHRIWALFLDRNSFDEKGWIVLLYILVFSCSIRSLFLVTYFIMYLLDLNSIIWEIERYSILFRKSRGFYISLYHPGYISKSYLKMCSSCQECIWEFCFQIGIALPIYRDAKTPDIWRVHALWLQIIVTTAFSFSLVAEFAPK